VAAASDSSLNPEASAMEASSPPGAGRMPPLPGQAAVNPPMDLSSRSQPVPDHLPSVDAEDPAEYDTGLPANTLYAALPAARAHFADKLPFGVDDRSYIEFNRAALRGLEAGSALTLRTPDDGREHRVQ